MREKVMSPKSGGVSRAVGWKHFVYGGAASCIAEGGTFPLDTTKTRLQVQGQQAKHLISGGISPVRSPYKGMIDAIFRISREEGISALYRGISPALLRQSIYGTLKFGVYYSLKKVFEEESVTSNIFCAIIAGMASSAVANPTDVLKVRMQVSSTAGTSSLFASFHKIYLLEGVAGLWRGVGPTSQRAGVIAAVELPVYDGCKRYFIENGILDDAIPNHMISSFAASLAAVIFSTPIDVIRTRLMSQKLNRGESSPVKPGKTYRGSWHCFVVTFRHEGFRALYKGFIPAWLRMGPWNLIFFTSYEQLLRLY